MPDSTVLRWKQRGIFYFWRYRDSRPGYVGWHFHADDEGCESLKELLMLMKDATYSSRNTIRVSEPPPNVIGITNQGSRWYSASSIEIRYPKERVDDDTWELSETRGKLLLIIGKKSLEDILEVIPHMQEGIADGCLGYEKGNVDMQLWFW